MAEQFLDGRVILHAGDCREVLAQLDENSLDSCVTDPPYHLTSIVQRFGAEDAAPAMSAAQRRFAKTGGADRMPGTGPFGRHMDGLGKTYTTGAYGGRFKEADGGTGAAFARMSKGFMGKQWDGGDIAFDPATWHAVYRVLKPGAHLVAMGGTRTYHRMACAIEDAGFEIRDTISWLYGSGFPKSHDVSKGIDRAAGVVRDVVGIHHRHGGGNAESGSMSGPLGTYSELPLTNPATDAARQWDGWGTALKPACELIVLARKPLSEGTVAANVLRWGTGAINVDGCRVTFADAADEQESKDKNRHGDFETGPRNNLVYGKDDRNRGNYNPPGRWPANVVHDGSTEVTAAFPDVGETSKPGTVFKRASAANRNGNIGSALGAESRQEGDCMVAYGDSGSAARFFYTAKANQDDRLGSSHPTVKPLDLMQWLVRLVTPPRGLVLDPFAGTGTTGEAAWREGMAAVLIEAEAEYQADIRRRMALALAGPDERVRESIKAKGLPADPGPLFEWRSNEEAAE
jgi:DNA modification methylase